MGNILAVPQAYRTQEHHLEAACAPGGVPCKCSVDVACQNTHKRLKARQLLAYWRQPLCAMNAAAKHLRDQMFLWRRLEAPLLTPALGWKSLSAFRPFEVAYSRGSSGVQVAMLSLAAGRPGPP